MHCSSLPARFVGTFASLPLLPLVSCPRAPSPCCCPCCSFQVNQLLGFSGLFCRKRTWAEPLGLSFVVWCPNCFSAFFPAKSLCCHWVFSAHL